MTRPIPYWKRQAVVLGRGVLVRLECSHSRWYKPASSAPRPDDLVWCSSCGKYVLALGRGKREAAA